MPSAKLPQFHDAKCQDKWQARGVVVGQGEIVYSVSYTHLGLGQAFGSGKNMCKSTVCIVYSLFH